jgi:hypothetical protein
MQKIIYDKEIQDENIKETAIEIVIVVLERIPSLGKKDT